MRATERRSDEATEREEKVLAFWFGGLALGRWVVVVGMCGRRCCRDQESGKQRQAQYVARIARSRGAGKRLPGGAAGQIADRRSEDQGDRRPVDRDPSRWEDHTEPHRRRAR